MSGSNGFVWTKAAVIIWAVLALCASDAVAQKPQFGGYLLLDKRFVRSGEKVRIADFYNRLRLEMSVDPGSQLSLFASLEARFYDFSPTGEIRQLSELSFQYPTDLSIWEAFVDVRGFLFSNVDLRIGKQRIPWGTADGLNPTDNLNPDDFSDLVDFTRKVPSWAVRADIYLGEATLTGIWLPGVRPVLLPQGLQELFQVPLQEKGWKMRLKLPERTPQNSMMGLKLSARLDRVDLSVSYFRGYDDIPAPRGVYFAPGRTEYLFILPKIQVLGIDFATEAGGAGIWGEAGIFFPEELRFFYKSIGGLNQSYETIYLPDDPYMKFTLGGDYTFPRGWYVNAQWMHGFFVERGKNDLHDYLVLALEKNVLGEKLRLKLGGAVEKAGGVNGEAVYGYGFFPELVYREVDNLEISLGGFWTDGDPGTLFSAFLDVDQVYVRVKGTF